VIATIVSGSLGYVLVPAIADRIAAGSQRDAAKVASQVGAYLLALSVLITAFVVIEALPLTALLCPGFSSEEREMTAGLIRILAALITANSLIAHLNALYHSYQRFAAPAIAGVIGTLVTLLYVVILHQRQGIFSVAWGIVAGAAVTVVLLLPLVASQLKLSGAATLQAVHPATRRCLWLLMPLVLGAIYWRLDPLLDRYLASRLPTGSIAHLGYAWRLISGLMLIGTSGLSIVAFPAIAAHAAAGRRAELSAELAHAIRFFLFLIVPICMGLAAFRVPVVRLLFEHGKFTSSDTQAVALLVALYVGVISGAGLGDLLSRTCYAQQDTRTPVIIHSLNFTLVALLKFAVVGQWQAAGLVAATSLYYLINCVALGAILLRRLGIEMLTKTPGTLFRSILSSLVGCLAARLVMELPLSWAVLPAAACAALVYLLTMWLLGDEFAVKFERSLLHRRRTRPKTA
jgi:putative peptidoglycan lipid II flippase